MDVEAILAAPPGDRRLLLDGRTLEENARGHIPGAAYISLGEKGARLDELPRDQDLAVCCKVRQRGDLATRILRQAGYSAANGGGGDKTYQLLDPETNGGR